jgi:hypothetical protein
MPTRDVRSLPRCADERGLQMLDSIMVRAHVSAAGERGQTNKHLPVRPEVRDENPPKGRPRSPALGLSFAASQRQSTVRDSSRSGTRHRDPLPTRMRDTMQKLIALVPPKAASVRSSHDRSNAIDRPAFFRKYLQPHPQNTACAVRPPKTIAPSRGGWPTLLDRGA